MCDAHADVKLFPFHTTSAALPELPGKSWRELLSAPGQNSSEGVQRTAGIILAEPHFVLVSPVC
jgi:hypothetical protein